MLDVWRYKTEMKIYVDILINVRSLYRGYSSI